MGNKEIPIKENIKNKLKVNEKTKKILIGGAIAVVAVGGGIILYKFHCTKVNGLMAEITRLTGENAKLTAENTKLIAENVSKTRKIIELEGTISELKKLCHIKDGYFIETISDGLRHGSPIAAKHMADLRWLQAA